MGLTFDAQKLHVPHGFPLTLAFLKMPSNLMMLLSMLLGKATVYCFGESQLQEQDSLEAGLGTSWVKPQMGKKGVWAGGGSWGQWGR